MVSFAEGKELTNSGAVAASANDQDWDAGWDDGEGNEKSTAEEPSAANEDDGADAWGWDDDPEEVPDETPADPEEKTEDDDGTDAWGWGDEDVTEQPAPEPEPKPKATKPAPAPKRKGTTEMQTREMVLRETYHVSSMPEPVLNLILAILEDGVALTGEG